MRARFAGLYGSVPGHLVALLLCFALTGYTVFLLTDEAGLPVLVKITIWFVGSALAWDLVLGPLLALADRGLQPLQRAGALNHVRIPALFSALLLLVWAPVIFERSETIFRNKAGLSQDIYSTRWLLITAAVFGASAVVYAVGRLRARSTA